MVNLVHYNFHLVVHRITLRSHVIRESGYDNFSLLRLFPQSLIEFRRYVISIFIQIPCTGYYS